ncbi:hypothetical protein OH77DRAFT_1495973 [Trametes cingulata]|nr:hypothetical protein OH77DRAFT_1495973 [Trametes cingulata]
MSLLVLRLGGRKLLYAMSQYISLPSIRSLRRARVFTTLMPSLGFPKVEEVLYNVRQVFSSKAEDSKLRKESGTSIMWDELSVEEKADYFPHVDCVGGFCREHSGSVNTRLSTFDNAVNMAERLHDGTLHYGKEASVVALGSFSSSRELRGAHPILVSLTCKAESPKESAKVLSRVFAALKEAGLDDTLWSFASDGDAGRRVMVHDLFMKHEVTPDHPLYPLLGGLPGMNLLVGDNDVTGDFDWKHEIKRE